MPDKTNRVSVGLKLYPDQKAAWDRVCGNRPISEHLQEAMRLYCEVYHVEFPVYEVAPHGGDRKSSKHQPPKRVR